MIDHPPSVIEFNIRPDYLPFALIVSLLYLAIDRGIWVAVI
jgi:hypothetical protein